MSEVHAHGQRYVARIDYNPIAAEYAKHRRVHPEVLRRLVEAVGTDRDVNVLEVGCGSGNYITAIQTATGNPCFGIDPHE